MFLNLKIQKSFFCATVPVLNSSTGFWNLGLTTQTHSSQTNRSKHTHASASIQQPEGVVVVHLHHPAADTARTQATHSLDHTPRPARPVCCSMQAKPGGRLLFLRTDQTNTQLDPACQGRQELGNLMKKEPIMALARRHQTNCTSNRSSNQTTQGTVVP